MNEHEVDYSRSIDSLHALSDREHRRNMVALKLAALDLMSTQQIRVWAKAAGLTLPDTEDRKVLIEGVRRGLMGIDTR